MATILVTGGAGYVGSHACKALKRAGYTPVTYDNLGRGHRELVKWGPLVEGDLHDTDGLRAALRTHRPAAVMHFASLIDVAESVAQPEMYRHNIVEGTRSLLAAMKAEGVNRIVVSSSCSIYGVPDRMPIDETAPRRPNNPYGAAKLGMEELLAQGTEHPDLAWTSMRYFNAAGADPDGETGEWHEPENHLIPRVLDVAMGRATTVFAHGGDYPTPDGTCVRDYIHVNDLAEAHLLALNGDYAGMAFNLGTGGGYSVRQVVETARAVTGRDIPLQVGPRRPGDPAFLVADSGRAARTLGWTARRPLADQIGDAWAWHRKLHG